MAFDTNAAKPKKVQTKSATSEQFGIAEQILSDQYAAAKVAAAAGPFGGIQMGTIIGPPQCNTGGGDNSDPSSNGSF
jgi:hypothetical protein